MRDERQRNRFVVPESKGSLTQVAVNGCVRQLNHGTTVRRKRIRKLVVSVQPSNLLDHVDLALHIQAPARNLYAELRIRLSLGNQVESEPLQQTKDQPRIQALTKNAAHFADAKQDGRLIHLFRNY